MEIVVPTHGRAGSVTTHETVEGCVLCVAESQYKAYKEFYPNLQYLVHPDEVRGISRKRAWILRQFSSVFMLDDDIQSVNRTYLPSGMKKEKISPIDARGIIFDTYHHLKSTDIKLFGFSKSPSPLHYQVSKPIMMNGFIQGAAMGFVDTSNLNFPEIDTLTGEDEYICLLNAFYNRKMWIDKRFFFQFKTDNYNIGGCGEFRNKEVELSSFAFLKKHFGNSVVADYTRGDQIGDYPKWRVNIPY